MLKKVCRTSVAFLLAILMMISGLGFVGQSSVLASDNSSIVQRLQELRSTSPESGLFDVQARTFDVAVADSMIESLQSMSESVAMGLESNNPELKALSNTWHDELESTLGVVQQMRSSAVRDRFAALKSVSPESGI